MCMEKFSGVVRSRATSTSLALTIPHHLRVKHGIEKGDYFVVKIDEQERIVYEKLPGGEDNDAPTPGLSRRAPTQPQG